MRQAIILDEDQIDISVTKTPGETDADCSFEIELGVLSIALNERQLSELIRLAVTAKEN